MSVIYEILQAMIKGLNNLKGNSELINWQQIEKAPKLCSKSYRKRILAYPVLLGNKRNSICTFGITKCLTYLNLNDF